MHYYSNDQYYKATCELDDKRLRSLYTGSRVLTPGFCTCGGGPGVLRLKMTAKYNEMYVINTLV